MTYKTTVSDFEYFKERCLSYMEELSLGEWQISFVHDKDAQSYGYASVCFGETTLVSEDRIATIYLAHKWENVEPTSERLDACAYHEMAHVLLYPVIEKLLQFYSESFVKSLWHDVVRRMEKARFGGFLEF